MWLSDVYGFVCQGLCFVGEICITPAKVEFCWFNCTRPMIIITNHRCLSCFHTVTRRSWQHWLQILAASCPNSTLSSPKETSASAWASEWLMCVTWYVCQTEWKELYLLLTKLVGKKTRIGVLVSAASVFEYPYFWYVFPAQLALKHRQGKNHKMRIIAFVGSPVEDNEKEVSWKSCITFCANPTHKTSYPLYIIRSYINSFHTVNIT